MSIRFDLPDVQARVEIFKRYANQFKEEELKVLAEQTDGFSGRGIFELCKNVERKWASKIIRKEEEDYIPSLEVYRDVIEQRKENGLV